MTETWLRHTLEQAIEVPAHMSLDLEAITLAGHLERQQRRVRQATGAMGAAVCVAAVAWARSQLSDRRPFVNSGHRL